MSDVINRINHQFLRKLLTWFIASVWFTNGLFCKVLGFVPRHEQIVSKILSPGYSHSITIIIGISEICMAIWVLSNFRVKLNAVFQIVLVATMNIMEFILAPDLLLWGKFNLIFSFIFILIVFINGFYLTKK